MSWVREWHLSNYREAELKIAELGQLYYVKLILKKNWWTFGLVSGCRVATLSIFDLIVLWIIKPSLKSIVWF